MLKKIISFLTTDIWRIRLQSHPKPKAFLLKQLRIILLAFRGYREDKCQFRASALTFYTLLSIVPIIAMAFGISKGFGLEKMLQQQIMERFQGQEEVAEKIIVFANKFLENIQSSRGDIIAGIGVAILFMTIIRVLGNIENSFNLIWGVQKSRHLGRKFSDYLSVMLICPVLLIISSSSTVFIASQIQNITERIAFLGAFQNLILISLKLLPYCSLWLVFSFIFIFMPNTKVNLRSGILAGIITGTVFQIVQLLYVNLQFGVTRSNAIYGSFAALPLFLVWLQVSWLIVLFGAEVSFAHQNVETYELEPDCLGASYSVKKKVSLLIAGLLAKNFHQSKAAISAADITKTYDLPVRLVREVLNNLVGAGIVSEVRINGDKDFGYQPGRDIEMLTINDVANALEARGNSDLPMPQIEQLDRLSNHLENLNNILQNSNENVLLKDI